MPRKHTDNMRLLWLRNPYGSYIVTGQKTVELRSQNSLFRGEVWIFSSQTLAFKKADWQALKKKKSPEEYEYMRLKSHLLGRANLVRVRNTKAGDAKRACVPKIDRWCIAWEMQDAQALPEPVPWPKGGKLGLCKPDSDDRRILNRLRKKYGWKDYEVSQNVSEFEPWRF